MHDRRLVWKKRTLGRIYPSDIESEIDRMSKRLDAMMASSLNLAMAADTDLSGRISEVNATLTNEVVLPSDQLSDDQARAKLSTIQNELQDLENIFFENNVEIGQGAGQLTANVISKKQAQDLDDQLDKAFNIYNSIVDRYGLVKGYVNAASALPATGLKLTNMMSAFDYQIRSIDSKIAPLHTYQEQLQTAIANASGDAVAIDRDRVRRMQETAAAVFQGDEALKRIEAIALRKPVAPTPSAKPPHSTPWALIGIAGIVLVGLAFFAATD